MPSSIACSALIGIRKKGQAAWAGMGGSRCNSAVLAILLLLPLLPIPLLLSRLLLPTTYYCHYLLRLLLPLPLLLPLLLPVWPPEAGDRELEDV